MTRDDILRLAREAGGTLSSFDRWSMHTSDVVRFSALVAAAEREACAKVCEAQENKVVVRHPARIEFDPDSMMASKCAAAIRARGGE